MYQEQPNRCHEIKHGFKKAASVTYLNLSARSWSLVTNLVLSSFVLNLLLNPTDKCINKIIFQVVTGINIWKRLALSDG